MQGFIVHDFHDKFDEALQQLAQYYSDALLFYLLLRTDRFVLFICRWYREGKLKKQVFLQRGGLTAGPRAFTAMMHGENIGKTLVKV